MSRSCRKLYRPKNCIVSTRRNVWGLRSTQTLNKIRKERLTQLGLKDTASYANDRRIQEELDYFNEIISNIGCPVIDVSEMAIEETANEIMKYVDGRIDVKG